jgi:hypothetical protein
MKKVIRMAILSTMLIVTAAVFAAQQPEQEMAATQGSQSLENATVDVPLRQKTNKLIQELEDIGPKIEQAVKAIQAARSKKDIYAELDKGQSQVRILLNTIKEDGIFVKEIQALLEERKVELDNYKSLKISEKQLKTLTDEETQVIAGFEKLLKDVRNSRETLKELDETFSSTRTFMASLLSVRSTGQALKIASDSVASLTEISNKFLKHIKTIADEELDVEHTPE